MAPPRLLRSLVVLSLVAAPLVVATSTAEAVPLQSGGVVDFGCATSGKFHCLGKSIRSPKGSGPLLNSTPVGYGPAEIQAAYNLGGLHANGRTVAIVDAQDAPTAEADLAKFRSARGLSPCTTANGCFKKVNQNGAASPLPAPDYGWAMEISLDLDAVSATCPDCDILLVEANSPDTDPLMTAVDTAAATPGVVAISNSYGGTEDSTILAADAHLNHPGIAVTASSGDSGYGVSWPASSPYVTAVGGTTLKKSMTTARGWTETTWKGSGSGCSALEAKPAWQHDTGCAKRTVADVSAVADPATGLGVYDTYNSCGSSSFCDLLLSLGLAQGADGWIQVGGTSLSSPVIASVYALAGNSVTSGSYPYAHTDGLYDVTSGSNGSCGGTYLCTAGTGYDGPTGLGTPHGTSGF
ncbi:S53 family peptidase [Amycolatopsis sp. NPDC049159]|uniref:S53 family peptidase n=1 Tax=Amycolatopsis sp. NPDC049159 TaxID=3157210 RepID=UPI0033ECEFEB